MTERPGDSHEHEHHDHHDHEHHDHDHEAGHHEHDETGHDTELDRRSGLTDATDAPGGTGNRPAGPDYGKSPLGDETPGS